MIVDAAVETGKKNKGLMTGMRLSPYPQREEGFESDGYNGTQVGHQNGVARDYLRFAIQRAVEGAESYRNAALMVGGERRDLLFYMAGVKNKQAITLKIIDPDIGASIFESKASGKSGSISNYFLDVEFRPLDNLDEVFLFLYKGEHKSLDIYTKLAQLERDPEVRTLFLYLIQLQTADIFRLESEFAKLSKREDVDIGTPEKRERVYENRYA
jgi:hypothetical protein